MQRGGGAASSNWTDPRFGPRFRSIPVSVPTGESLTAHKAQEPQAALRATAKSCSLGAARVPQRASLSESRMREIRPSGSMSGE